MSIPSRWMSFWWPCDKLIELHCNRVSVEGESGATTGKLMKKKTLSSSLLAVLLTMGSLAGAPMKIESIPAEAKWVAHLNMEAIRASRVGQFALNEIVAKRIPTQEGLSIDIPAAIQLIDGISVYGESMEIDTAEKIPESGLVVVAGHPQLGAMVQGLIAYMTLEEQATLLQEEPFQIVQMEDGTIGALLSPSRFILSKSREIIDRFLATAKGEHENLLEARSFDGLDVGDVDAAVVVLAGGLGNLEGKGPEARVFKLSKGIALRLAEVGDDLALRATLETNSSESALRVQQILQGMIAIASFAQMDDENLSTLLRSTVVRSAERLVHLEVAFPSQRIVEILEAELPPIEIADDATGGNALAVTVTYSSAETVCCPANLADNDPDTGWRIDGDALSATFELRKRIDLQTVDIEWAREIGKAFNFTLSTSIDGKDWKRRIVWEGGGTPPDSIALSPAPSEYLKIELTRPEWGPLGMRSLRLNGALPSLASATSSSDGRALPGNLFDSDRETVFDGLGSPVLVEGKLDRLAEIREVGFLWAKGGEKQIQVYTSPDGIEWVRVLAIAQNGEAAQFQRFNARDLKARYVRILSPNPELWGQAREIRFYGEIR